MYHNINNEFCEQDFKKYYIQRTLVFTEIDTVSLVLISIIDSLIIFCKWRKP